MANFPIFNSLNIQDYGLYPGADKAGVGLRVDFQPGLTLVLGTNGLGKTTLITILYRLLTGPFDIQGLSANRTGLGTASLVPTRLPTATRQTFARRVMDNARHATARLSFQLGSHNITVERQLDNLNLTYFGVDDEEMSTDDPRSFHSKIPELAGVWSFSDWILLLRYLTFYFEDRRALVWDPSAQRQILRVLCLPVTTAKQWTKDEREILELDSRMRNLSAALYREENALVNTEKEVQSERDVRTELSALEEQQKVAFQERERLAGEVLEADRRRQDARLKVLKAEQEYEERYRSIERAKLLSIGARFPNESETAKYIYAQLLTKLDCLVCGNHVPEAAANYSSRVERGQCVVCGSNLVSSEEPTENTETIARATEELRQFAVELGEARLALEQAEELYNSYVSRFAECEKGLRERSQRAEYLVRQLPPEEAELHKQRADLSVMRGRVEEMKEQLRIKRTNFKGFVDSVKRDIVGSAQEIKESFDKYAEGFLLEQCRLTWSSQRDTVGIGGSNIPIEFLAFELEMTGTDFISPVRRSEPEQVSESQREFIDLAFRMALMSVASDSGSSLVIDAPESSLDAVFAPRAAKTLSRFADPELGNRMIITSNLVEGKLIPSLIDQATTVDDRPRRVINLIELAAPTAAVREHRDKYEEVLGGLMAGSPTIGSS